MTTDKGPCPTCGTADAVDLADGWTTRMDDLYAEWCNGNKAGRREALDDVASMVALKLKAVDDES